MGQTVSDTVTRLLGDINGGQASISDLLPVVYEELREEAGVLLRHQGSDETLQATGLVHEVAGRLLEHSKTDWNDRVHFFAVCARAMRQILTDHARRRTAGKRGHGWERVALVEIVDDSQTPYPDVLALDEALSELGTMNARMSQVVECRFFAGMNNKEIAAVLSVSIATVENDWRAAKAWLGGRFRKDGAA